MYVNVLLYSVCNIATASFRTISLLIILGLVAPFLWLAIAICQLVCIKALTAVPLCRVSNSLLRFLSDFLKG